MDRMTVSVEWKAAGDDGTLEGYASTFGNVDLGADVVEKGAFTKTIRDIKASGIPLLADHVAATGSVLGTIYDAQQDSKGLLIKARFSSAPSAQDVRTKLVEGHLNKMSIGYEPTKFAFAEREGKQVRLLQEIKLWETSVVVFPMNPEATIERVKSLATDLTSAQRQELATAITRPDEKATANDIRDQLNTLVRETYGSDSADVWIRDWDESTVWFDVWDGQQSGTYEQAYSTDDDGSMSLVGERTKVRAVTTYVPDDKTATHGAQTKRATTYADLPLYDDRKRAYEDSAVLPRVRKWASTDGSGDVDKIDFDKYRKAFLWYDEDKPEEVGSYRLKIADVIDGKLYAIWRGVTVIAGVMQGSRGGTTIPAADRDAVKSQIEKYYAKARTLFDDDTIAVPWAKKDSGAGGVEEAEARHAEADETKGAAPAGGDQGSPHWSRYASEAVLAGDDPTALADPARRAALQTALELGEKRDRELAAASPDDRARLAASLRAAEALV